MCPGPSFVLLSWANQKQSQKVLDLLDLDFDVDAGRKLKTLK